MTQSEIKKAYEQIQEELAKLETQQRALMVRWHKLQQQCNHPGRKKSPSTTGNCPDFNHYK